MRFYQIYLVAYIVLFAFSFRVKNILQRKRTGIDPYRFDKSESPQQRFLERYGKCVSAGWFLLICGFAFIPGRMSSLGIPLFIEISILRGFALVASFIFLIGLIIAQWQMSDSWRIGLDEENRTELVTTGLFRYSRNPVFTLILCCLGAITVVLPCFVTILMWCLSFSGIYLQVLAEEDFLLKQHAEIYERYRSKTSRFLPNPLRKRK